MKSQNNLILIKEGVVSVNNAEKLLRITSGKTGCTITVTRNAKLKHPIFIEEQHNTKTGILLENEITIIGEENSSFDIYHISRNTQLHGCKQQVHTEITLEKGSSLCLVKIQDISRSSLIDFTALVQKSQTTSKIVTISLSGSSIQNDIKAFLQGKDSNIQLFGLFTPSGNDTLNTHTRIEHRAPNTCSNELYKGILGGNSNSMFYGEIYVDKMAKQTHAYQQNKNILLSDNAHIVSKPHLEIYTDDVQCTHGSATGYINDELVHYAESRGLPPKKARNLLLYGFAEEILSSIAEKELYNATVQRLSDVLDTKRN